MRPGTSEPTAPSIEAAADTADCRDWVAVLDEPDLESAARAVSKPKQLRVSTSSASLVAFIVFFFWLVLEPLRWFAG